jgi:hypothetical protein
MIISTTKIMHLMEIWVYIFPISSRDGRKNTSVGSRIRRVPIGII